MITARADGRAARTTTRSLVWRGGTAFGIEPWPLPPLGQADVLVRVTGCGLCGSDLHVFAGEALDAVPPRVFGHEPTGLVEEAGGKATSFRPGDQVTWEPSLPCGSCFQCREGEDGLCEQRITSPGAFATHTVLPARALYHLPAGLPPELGVLTEPLACAMHAWWRGAPRVGDTVAITGAGTIGLMLVALARRAGAGMIVVSEPSAFKRVRAREMGADHIVDPREVPAGPDAGRALLAEVTREVTAGRGAEVVFDAAGTPASLTDGLAAARPGGRVVLVGLGGGKREASLPLFSVMRRDLTIHAVWMRRFSFQRALELLPTLGLDPLITHTTPLEETARAADLLRDGSAIKVVVRP